MLEMLSTMVKDINVENGHIDLEFRHFPANLDDCVIFILYVLK